MSKDEELTAVVKQWWDLESYGTVVAVDNRSSEDKRALAHLNDTIRYNHGRYSVGILWSGQEENLQNNYSAALSQLKSLGTRLGEDEKLKERYSETIENDRKKGYVSQLETSEVNSDKTCWYLPHHPVLNPNKPEKVRRVCNAASKFRGNSLNDVLLISPDLLRSLWGIIFRFREKPAALSADIEEMFLQVEVEVNDKKYLRFLWRKDDGQIQLMKYNRHIFGAKSSPTCANFALQQRAKDFKEEFLEASRVVLSSFYMDDLLVAVDSIEKAKALSSELQKLLTKGSFNLSKWASNESEVFKDQMTPEKNPTRLGLEWLLHSDELKVCRGVSFDVQQQWTERKVLSKVSSLFDPLGFVVPFSIRGKLIMKRSWQTQGRQWDKPIEESLQKSFNTWISELPQNNPIAVGRWYKTNSDDKKSYMLLEMLRKKPSVQLHML